MITCVYVCRRHLKIICCHMIEHIYYNSAQLIYNYIKKYILNKYRYSIKKVIIYQLFIYNVSLTLEQLFRNWMIKYFSVMIVFPNSLDAEWVAQNAWQYLSGSLKLASGPQFSGIQRQAIRPANYCRDEPSKQGACTLALQSVYTCTGRL